MVIGVSVIMARFFPLDPAMADYGKGCTMTLPPSTTWMRNSKPRSKDIPTSGSVSAASISMIRGCPSQITAPVYTFVTTMLPSASVTWARPRMRKPNERIKAVGKVKKPENPVSITALIS
jgi:hypothetical protein